MYTSDDELTFPGDVADVDRTNAISNALDILALVDDAIPSDTAHADVKGRVIGVEAVVKKMVDGDNVDDAISEVEDINSQLYTDLKTALDNGGVDFTALTQADFGASDYDDIALEDNDSFADLMDKQLYISINSNGHSGEGYFFFNSDNGANGGELKVCLGYDDGKSGEPQFEETDGVLLTGIWLALDDDGSKLILRLAGSLSLGLLDKGVKDGDHRYSLNYGGEMRTWVSEDGILDNVAPQSVLVQPTDDESCAALLNTNIPK